MKKSVKIETGSKVAIIGGGPAGSSFALYLLRYAKERGVYPEITIYEPRNFDELGPKGCKGCAGILSMSALGNLHELGLTIPNNIVQSKVERYTVHSPYNSISISNPEKSVKIGSIYRGGGPRISQYNSPVSFDSWMLKQAQERGVAVANETVAGICLEDKISIQVADKQLDYNMIVLATGANAELFPISGLNYIPPKTRIMAVDELYVGTAQVESKLGNAAHAFLIPNSAIIFGTLVPKGPYINVSVLSSGEHPVSVTSFLTNDIVKRILPESYQRVCGCRPRVVISSARNYYGDGFIAIGDAAVARLYKDGIGSALLTARQAARTAIQYGISRSDFKRYYAPFCNSIDRDNRWGHLLFSINIKAKESPHFIFAQQRLIGDEQHNSKGTQPFTKAAWGMFSGNYGYGNIAWMTLNPFALLKLSITIFREYFANLYRKESTQPRKLHVGHAKVLILGSGFGGTYVLRYLVPSLNRNENVETTMVSDENFFLFSPLLHEVATGGIEPHHIAYPIRRLHWRDRFNFIKASVEKIDLASRRVTTTAGTLEFDYLVLALGSLANLSGLPSAKENVFTLKTLRDSMLIRNHIIEVFEKASIEKSPELQRALLSFVICGAGHIGVQIVTELRDFIYRTLIRFYKTIDTSNIRIILVEAEPKIMADLHKKLGAYAMKELKQMGIEVRLRTRITGVWEDHVELNGTESLTTSTVIWVAGVVANPRIAELDMGKDSSGRISVTEYLEVPGFSGVYAVGDCVHFEDPSTGQPIPPRAHLAVRQARVVAYNILADIRGKNKNPYRYSNVAEMVSLGSSTAMLRFYGLRLYGFLARLLWLVGYTTLVTGNYNRIRIITDWLLSLIFGRDTAFLKLTK